MSLFDIIRRKLKLIGEAEPKTVRSARERLRKIHAAYGGESIDLKQQLDSLGKVKSLTASTSAIEELVEELSASESAAVAADACQLPYFFQAFRSRTSVHWTLADLDQAFEGWHKSIDRGRFAPHVVMRITGAAFGNYCNAHLQLRWVAITDALGRDLAVRSLDGRVTGFPFSTVQKRIDANETWFFERVFDHLCGSFDPRGLEDE